MNNYTIIFTGTPFVPYTIEVTAAINVSQTFEQTVGSAHEAGSPAFLAELETAKQNAENAYKTLPEFSTQDSARNGTFTYEPLPTGMYKQTCTWTIVNAEIKLTAQSTTDLLWQALNTHLQEVANLKVAEFKAWANWSDL